MKKEYWFILIAYIGMQLSGVIGIPIVAFFGTLIGKSFNEMANSAVSIWLLFSFTITLIIILFLLRKEMINPIRGKDALSPRESIYWGIAGIFLSFFAQTVAANIEYLIGIELGSENTEQIVGSYTDRTSCNSCYFYYWTDSGRNYFSKNHLW